VADDRLARTLNATDPDPKRFKDRGGKLIVYHGWNDAAVSPLNSIDYFRSVQSKMGAKQTDGFLRLYLAPGMQHCGGGPGPDSFGQNDLDAADPQHSVTKALERWVEDREAPGKIIATKYKTDGNPASDVVRTRPLRPFPQVARHIGSGNTDDAASFARAMP
jgi:feruloyl esterase